jgi:hypothetical protein
MPTEPNHPRANEYYFKVQIGPLKQLSRPIVSLQWRRITFIHTTWDRFQDASEINDLFIEGGDYVDRKQAVLKDGAEDRPHNYHISEAEEQNRHD